VTNGCGYSHWWSGGPRDLHDGGEGWAASPRPWSPDQPGGCRHQPVPRERYGGACATPRAVRHEGGFSAVISIPAARNSQSGVKPPHRHRGRFPSSAHGQCGAMSIRPWPHVRLEIRSFGGGARALLRPRQLRRKLCGRELASPFPGRNCRTLAGAVDCAVELGFSKSGWWAYRQARKAGAGHGTYPLAFGDGRMEATARLAVSPGPKALALEFCAASPPSGSA
jgi:hypothetical protein